MDIDGHTVGNNDLSISYRDRSGGNHTFQIHVRVIDCTQIAAGNRGVRALAVLPLPQQRANLPRFGLPQEGGAPILHGAPVENNPPTIKSAQPKLLTETRTPSTSSAAQAVLYRAMAR